MPMSLTVAAISKGLEELCGLYDNVSYIWFFHKLQVGFLSILHLHFLYTILF